MCPAKTLTVLRCVFSVFFEKFQAQNQNYEKIDYDFIFLDCLRDIGTICAW